jgi:hypothetical protein
MKLKCAKFPLMVRSMRHLVGFVRYKCRLMKVAPRNSDMNMPHLSVSPVGSVKQVSEVLGSMTVTSSILRAVDRLLRIAGTYVPKYQVAHPSKCNYRCSVFRCETNKYLSSDTRKRLLILCIGSQIKEKISYLFSSKYLWNNSLMFVPCIIRSSRNNQHYTLNCTTLLFYTLAPTCLGSNLPSSGSFLDPSELLEIQIE